MEVLVEGSRVYLLDGRECEYVGAVGSMHVVRPIYEVEYGDQAGNPETVDGVYSEPPTEKLHKDVAELTEQVASLQSQQWELEASIRDSERVTKERLKKLSRYGGLKQIEDFVDGRITHCVITGQYTSRVEVLPVAEAMKKPDGYDRDMKLLCLFGDSKGDLTWRRNRYSDGSGSGWDECEPFCSEETAIARAKEILTEKLLDSKNVYSTGQTIESCKKLGVPIPPEFQATHDGYVRAAAETAIETASKALRAAEAQLAAITAVEAT